MAVIQDLEKFTDEEIDQKIQKLTNIVFSNNYNLSNQAKPILMLYYEEQARRLDKKFDDYSKNKGIKMDDIINIG